MAKFYMEGENWAQRRRYKNNDLYASGKTQREVEQKISAKILEVDKNLRPAGLGPDKTTLAQALQDFALKDLPYKKGALQESWRINHYLRYAGLQMLALTKIAPTLSDEKKKSGKLRTKYFEVALVPHTEERTIARGLHAHRREQLTQSANTEKYRKVLATTPVGKITRHLVQDFIRAMQNDGKAAASIANERAMLRGFFNHAFSVWRWKGLQDNPATMVKMPTVQNERERVMSQTEEARMDEALGECHNKLVAPVTALLRETAMRANEPLENAYWRDVDWTRRILTLHDPKEGGTSEVPLSPKAIEILRKLGPGEPDEKIVQITYEALRAAWKRACTRAGIDDLNLHDLRRTGATRLALKTGNIALVKALTRHKTWVMVHRYMRVKADDVVNVMHAAPEVLDTKPEEVHLPTEAPGAAMPHPAPPVEQAMAAPQQATGMFTYEQMQAMVEVAAKAALAMHVQHLQGAGPDDPSEPAPNATGKVVSLRRVV